MDKANLLATSRLWRSTTQRVADARGVPLRHTYVDRMAFELAHDDVVGDTVVLTEGIFGDILSGPGCGAGRVDRAVRIGQRESGTARSGPMCGPCSSRCTAPRPATSATAGSTRRAPTWRWPRCSNGSGKPRIWVHRSPRRWPKTLQAGPLTYDLILRGHPTGHHRELSPRP